MPWNTLVCAVIVLGGGCWFDADYRGGHFTCSDGACPGGLVCVADRCVTPGDAAPGDAVADGTVPIDARIAAATCADPMPFPVAGGTFSGSTAGRGNTITASCAGSVMNGNDAVYRIDSTSGDHLLVAITGALQAYAIAPCNPTPATPICIGNVVATAGNPISITATGTTFLVVDDVNPATSGAYALTVSH